MVYYSNVFDILNKTGIDELVNSVDTNNILCYKSLVLANPTVFKYEETSGRYYALSTTAEESSTGIFPKEGIGDTIPFAATQYWKFLDDVTMGTFVVDSYENFKYICSTGTTDYILSGSFVSNVPLTKLYSYTNSPTYNKTHQIYNDVDNNKLVFVRSDAIYVYDSSNYDDCNKLILIDKIPLKKSDTEEYLWNTTFKPYDNSNTIIWNIKYPSTAANNPYFIKFGKNVRTALDVKTLLIQNKYSSDIYQSIDLASYDVGNILDLDIRSVDDCVILLNMKPDGLYAMFLDPLDVKNTISNKPLYSISSNIGGQKIRFSDTDSNVFYTYNGKEYQSRYLSNPSYPSGRLETCDLKYRKTYLWNTTDETYNYIDLLWNLGNKSSNTYNNLLVSNISKYNKMYAIVHNIGRLYALNQNMNDRFLNSVPLDLVKYFDGVACGGTSIGLYLNISLQKILKDTLNLFNKAINSFTIEERKTIPRKLGEFIQTTGNFYMNGNETVNVIMLQRIMLTITNIQKTILSTTT